MTVSVLNGTGAYNQATDTATALTALGFHIVGVGDTTAGRRRVGDLRLLRLARSDAPRPPPSRWPVRCPVR